MLSAIAVIVGISLLILVHEAGHFWAAKKYKIKVEEFGFGFPPRIVSKQKGETRYSLNWLPFGGFVRLFGEHAADLQGRAMTDEEKKRSFTHQSAWRKITVIAAGISINFVIGWLIMSSVFMIGAADTVVVTAIAENSPAAIAQLEPGDQLLSYQDAGSFIDYVNAHRGEEITLRVLHSGEKKEVTVIPRMDPPKNEGALGVAVSQAGFPKLPFFSALKEGLVASLQIMGEVLKTFGNLIGRLFTKGEVVEGVVGPVGIFAVAGDLGRLGFVYILQLIGMISLNLAMLNALPFPALDGGRIFFILIEKIKGSAIGPKKELIANLVGFGLLLVLMIVVTVRDIIHLF